MITTVSSGSQNNIQMMAQQHEAMSVKARFIFRVMAIVLIIFSLISILVGVFVNPGGLFFWKMGWLVASFGMLFISCSLLAITLCMHRVLKHKFILPDSGITNKELDPQFPPYVHAKLVAEDPDVRGGVISADRVLAPVPSTEELAYGDEVSVENVVIGKKLEDLVGEHLSLSEGTELHEEHVVALIEKGVPIPGDIGGDLMNNIAILAVEKGIVIPASGLDSKNLSILARECLGLKPEDKITREHLIVLAQPLLQSTKVLSGPLVDKLEDLASSNGMVLGIGSLSNLQIAQLVHKFGHLHPETDLNGDQLQVFAKMTLPLSFSRDRSRGGDPSKKAKVVSISGLTAQKTRASQVGQVASSTITSGIPSPVVLDPTPHEVDPNGGCLKKTPGVGAAIGNIAGYIGHKMQGLPGIGRVIGNVLVIADDMGDLGRIREDVQDEMELVKDLKKEERKR